MTRPDGVCGDAYYQSMYGSQPCFMSTSGKQLKVYRREHDRTPITVIDLAKVYSIHAHPYDPRALVIDSEAGENVYRTCTRAQSQKWISALDDHAGFHQAAQSKRRQSLRRARATASGIRRLISGRSNKGYSYMSPGHMECSLASD